METKNESYTFDTYTPEQQGTGSFDGGKITEIKPIPFPQETGGSRRVGPLLYWAWASAKGDGVIGMHPHQGFEIVSYVIEGAVGHTDTAGNNRRVQEGGAQIMQTGSGVSHQEEMYGERTDFFQVWFEPNLGEALKRPPVYKDFEEEQFPIDELGNGVSVKRILGPQAPAQLSAPAVWDEYLFSDSSEADHSLASGSVAALVVIAGSAELQFGNDTKSLEARDFALIKTSESGTLRLKSNAEGTRMALITAPLDPGYPLYRF